MRLLCHPSGRAIDVQPGETVFAALRRAGVPIAASCDAEGICGRCGVHVVEGELSPPGALELQTAAQQSVDGRLSCCARLESDATITTSYW